MALVSCNGCGNEINARAESCPRCGTKIVKRPISSGTLVIVFALMAVVVAIMIYFRAGRP